MSNVRSFPQAARERAARPMAMRNTQHAHHVDTHHMSATCPPCNRNCGQGDRCPDRTRKLTEADLDRRQAEREAAAQAAHARRRHRERARFWRGYLLLVLSCLLILALVAVLSLIAGRMPQP